MRFLWGLRSVCPGVGREQERGQPPELENRGGDGLWRASQAWIRAAGRGAGGGGVGASEGA